MSMEKNKCSATTNQINKESTENMSTQWLPIT